MASSNWKIISRRKGAAAPVGAYILRRGAFADRTDLVAVHYGNLPSFCNGDPEAFLVAADRYERANAAACRELVLSFPRELTREQRIEALQRLAETDLAGKPHLAAIHDKTTDKGLHPHAHVLYSDRVLDGIDRPAELFFRRANRKNPERGGCRKDSGGKSALEMRIEVGQRKDRWDEILNSLLAKGGHSVRVNHRKHQLASESEEASYCKP